MTTIVFFDKACLGHNPNTDHPECPERLDAILEALNTPIFEALKYQKPPRASLEQLARIHGYSHIMQTLEKIEKKGFVVFDSDTFTSPGSYEAALRAAGSVCAAVDMVMSGDATNAFCAIRPPGHHAECSSVMGFCLFNNVAIGAAHARAIHDLKRIAVVDFDVHHGNGTQEAFWDNPYLFFASVHQSPLYPGTGSRSESGVADNILNVPLFPDSGSQEFREAMNTKIFPALLKFAPDFILISAGFDAHSEDTLASLNFKDDDYYWVTAKLCAIAAEVCKGRVVSTLEGGYELHALGRCAAAHVEALMKAR